jgi:hypothetical protein
MLIDEQGVAEREAMMNLLEALVNIGMSKEQYVATINDISECIPSGTGIKTCSWLFDLAFLVYSYDAPENNTRINLVTKILSCFTPITTQFTVAQRASYEKIAKMTDWPSLPSELDENDDFSSELDNKHIAIYTLTESAAKYAKSVLEKISPTAKIDLCHDSVCSERLKSISRSADIFVVTTAAAKHVATECINRYANKDSIRYAAGKGFSSIIRAVEEYMSESASS